MRISPVIFGLCLGLAACDQAGDSERGPENPGGTTLCTPSCAGSVCGDDGCGGSCGSCDGDTGCESGACIGRTCGDDGDCQSGVCANGYCVPSTWRCDATFFGDGDGCDCDCGAYDPDCVGSSPAVLNCDAYEHPSCDRAGRCASTACECGTRVCGDDGCGGSCGGCEGDDACTDGQCVARVPAAWTCGPSHYDGADGCDCGCGTYDPDCDTASEPPFGCMGVVNARCTAEGTCAPRCSCDGVVCGDDGCGNDCGTCPEGQQCADRFGERACVAPTPAGWTCAADAYASGGPCNCECGAHDPDCGDPAALVLGCGGRDMVNPTCDAYGRCLPSCSCDGVACGDDGCGNDCGSCPDRERCVDHACVMPAPEGWNCPDAYYADGALCDCNCGARDADCEDPSIEVYDCPPGTQCVAGECR